MRLSDFDFDLPPELIAQTASEKRDASRLLVVHRAGGELESRRFPDFLNYLRAGDLLVLNNSKVIPARLYAQNPETGGELEMLLLESTSPNEWWAMMKPAKRARVGRRLNLLDRENRASGITLLVLDQNSEGHRHLRFEGVADLLPVLDKYGEIPLPPYIQRPRHSSSDTDRERYQTVFASPPGSVAAPTAGLHFTSEFLEEIRNLGVNLAWVTLHVGPGTFAPVKTDQLEAHVMHEERYQISPAIAQAVRETKAAGGRIIAVGTTSLRVLESAVKEDFRPGWNKTRLFVHPPYSFQVVDGLLTNFHLPKSTLLMLVSAFADPGGMAGRDLVFRAYEKAIRERFRFFSYGDAMLILD